MYRLTLAALVFVASAAIAGPYIPAGDLALRHDIQRLADYGIISGAITTWPLAWGPVLRDIEAVQATHLPPVVLDSLQRVKQRANWETRVRELTYNTEIGVADNATRIRSFQNTPRGRAEASAGLSWIDERFSANLNVQYVDSARDEENARFDNSMLGMVAGNWSIAASTEQRWWGPGWDSSLILSNNARPFPSLTFDRIFTDPFNSKWLSWLGPWDFSVSFGQLEKERAVPDAQFFGFRFNFRPLRTLEIGVSRSAQWCGDGRPCDLETFVNLLLGRDNRNSDGVNIGNEPGNQLAGLDFRWAPTIFNTTVGFYGQFIGEDEAGGFPSSFIGQFGIEWSGYLVDRWSARVYAEYAGTAAKIFESEKRFNYAYNHRIYRTGYRYRGAAIGYGADNDAKLFSAGLVLVDASESQWRVLLRTGDLNYGGEPDPRNTLTPTPQELFSIDVAHSRAFRFGVVEAGVGYEQIDDVLSRSSSGDARFHLQWRSTY